MGINLGLEGLVSGAWPLWSGTGHSQHTNFLPLVGADSLCYDHTGLVIGVGQPGDKIERCSLRDRVETGEIFLGDHGRVCNIGEALLRQTMLNRFPADTRKKLVVQGRVGTVAIMCFAQDGRDIVL